MQKLNFFGKKIEKNLKKFLISLENIILKKFQPCLLSKDHPLDKIPTLSPGSSLLAFWINGDS